MIKTDNPLFFWEPVEGQCGLYVRNEAWRLADPFVPPPVPDHLKQAFDRYCTDKTQEDKEVCLKAMNERNI